MPDTLTTGAPAFGIPPKNRAESLIDQIFGVGSRPVAVEDHPLMASLREAGRLADTEDSRRGETLGFLRGEFDRANADSAIKPGEMAMRLGRATDAATGQSLDQWSTLRDALGSAGITGGGLAAGLGSQIELGRLGQITGAKRDLAIYESERQAKSASDRFLRSLGLAEYMNQGPSMALMDQLNNVISVNLNRDLGRMQLMAAREGADATRDAGDQAFWGSLIQGGLSLVSGLGF